MTVFAIKLFIAGFFVPVAIMFGILYIARQLRRAQEARSRRQAVERHAGDAPKPTQELLGR